MIILLRGYIQKAPFGALKDSYIPTHLTVLEGKQRTIRSVEGQVSPLTFNILGSVLLSLSCCLPQSDYSIDSYHFLPYIDYSMVSVHLAICRETFTAMFLANYIWGTVTLTTEHCGRGRVDWIPAVVTTSINKVLVAQSDTRDWWYIYYMCVNDNLAA